MTGLEQGAPACWTIASSRIWPVRGPEIGDLQVAFGEPTGFCLPPSALRRHRRLPRKKPAPQEEEAEACDSASSDDYSACARRLSPNPCFE